MSLKTRRRVIKRVVGSHCASHGPDPALVLVAMLQLQLLQKEWDQYIKKLMSCAFLGEQSSNFSTLGLMDPDATHQMTASLWKWRRGSASRGKMMKNGLPTGHAIHAGHV